MQAHILQALFIAREQIDFYRTRALIKALVDKEHLQEAFDDYRNAIFPFYSKMQDVDRQQHIKRLISEVGRGALAVTPLSTPKVKSKLKTKVVQRPDEMAQATRRVARKIGGSYL